MRASPISSSAVNTAPVRRLTNGLHRIRGPGIDRYGAEALCERELGSVDIHGIDLGRTEGARELDGGNAEPADAKDGDRIAGCDARLAQCMQRRRGGTHEDRALLERDRIRQVVGVSGGHADEFRETAIAILADHLPGRAELLAPGAAVSASAAGDEIVQAYAITRATRRDARANGFNDARDLVAQRERMAS